MMLVVTKHSLLVTNRLQASQFARQCKEMVRNLSQMIRIHRKLSQRALYVSESSPQRPEVVTKDANDPPPCE